MTKEKEIVYDNNWTKIGLGWLRGNKVFKSIWRGGRIAVVTALTGGALALLENLAPILTEIGISVELAVLIGPMLEKLMREYIPITKF